MLTSLSPSLLPHPKHAHTTLCPNQLAVDDEQEGDDDEDEDPSGSAGAGVATNESELRLIPTDAGLCAWTP